MNEPLSALLSLVAGAALMHQAHAQTNLQMNLGLPGQPQPIPFVRTPKHSIFERAVDRIEERSKSRLVHRLTLDVYWGDTERQPSEFGAKQSKGILEDGFKYSLREWALETPLYGWIDEMIILPMGDRLGRTGKWLSSFFRDTISGNEEKDNAQSPNELSFVEERKKFLGFKRGLRPFSHNPYVFLGYGWRDSMRELILESTLRLSLRDFREPNLSFATEIPLCKWSLGFGIEARTGGDREEEGEIHGRLFTTTDRAFDVTIGLKGHLFGGLVHIGADVLGERVVALWRHSF
ncbi:MAG: hypothetical protein Q7R93_01790 [bacterium]|nr:hypothetical protein [bacterium]